MLEGWEEKAHRIIRAQAEEAYASANNKHRRKHIPYTLTTLATRLVEILGMHDRAAAEYEAKNLFIMHACGVHPDSDLNEAA